MARRTKEYRGFEVVNNKDREEGKFYLDKPGQFEAEDVHLILYKKEKARKNLVIYLLDLEVIASCSTKGYLVAVSDVEFKRILRNVSGIDSQEIYLTKAGQQILEQYEKKENPNYC